MKFTSKKKCYIDGNDSFESSKPCGSQKMWSILPVNLPTLLTYPASKFIFMAFLWVYYRILIFVFGCYSAIVER